ncbi:hypothetical protein [Thermogemmatispora tikiterensis]|uniref:Ribosomal protein L7/L12 C-terminal domain-containing protein n=1 Tax=Thermogemmatispora tikiterensis TaxID=1825093 RepID=A0A328VKN8_9CHLR|nr:hypothetical protein [Thermogemmatispora tikiterensis]RAQ98017.1 hypothetical protein A4R35_20930 [Thermogemmatispora tikiterensis]
MTFWINIVLALVGILIALISLLLGRHAAPVRTPEECALIREQLIASGISPRVAEYVAQGKRLEAIKAYREETGQGLKEAVRYIDQLFK